ncbi:S-layer homology domain-containing protein [Sporomusa sphaeroides]|uniref:S-layer homology domain-containing protein n=1 Tax=Sporomusa sphaeroides TaxID=47679 RepID=UPI002BC58C7A|nr:S-layer homology domain-containing protein [Sporomusa sphaeroides]HML34129.1 S-layer homology domain-containing protein [Sporomusa sphaeroides]
MKRQTAMALAAVFAMSVAGTALAAPANPFVDVPAKHWSYDAVTKLAQAGVVSGYGDGTYKGDKTMTRYEMATIIAKAMANSEKADAETQKTIDALAAEYGAELNNLGVRVDNLEKKVGNVKFDGDVRFRYNNTDKDFNGKGNDLKARARIYAHGAINEDWTANIRFEAFDDMQKSGTDNKDNRFDILNVQGPLFGTKATLGRFDVVPVYGTVMDSFVEGAKFEFGNKLKTTLIYGKEDNQIVDLDAAKKTVGTADTNLGFVGLGYAASKATNLNAAYYHLKATNRTGTLVGDSNDALKIWELGFDSKIAKNLVLQASYIKSDMDYDPGDDKQDTAYQAGLWYKGAKKQNKGSFGAWATYLNVERDATVDSTWMTADPLGSQKGNGFKGVEVGFGYTLDKNILLKTMYFDGETTAAVENSKTGKDEKQDLKKLRAQVEFFF